MNMKKTENLFIITSLKFPLKGIRKYVLMTCEIIIHAMRKSTTNIIINIVHRKYKFRKEFNNSKS